MPITTQVTWQDLITTQQDQLDEYEDAYQELQDLGVEELGTDWQSTPAPDDLSGIEDDDLITRAVYQRQAELIDQAGKQLQKRIHLLETLQAEFGDGAFEVKMLSGREAMATEVDLRTDAQSDSEVDSQTLQVRRNQATVDAAVVDAPSGVPRDDDENPVPSECPNALVNSLYEAVERFNSAGDVDFRPEGFGSNTPSGGVGSVSPGTPSSVSTRSESSDPTENDAPESGG